MRLSVVIPALDEAKRIRAVVDSARLFANEVVVVDGGSDDDTAALASAAGAVVINAPRGRASQMNAGAARCTGEALLFLHADSRPPVDTARAIDEALGAGFEWGRFDVRLEPATLLLRAVAVAMNLRSRLSGIATGDQAIFVTRRAFDAIGGFPALDLMEDIALSSRLKLECGAPACLPGPVVADARRWHRDGALRTIGTMWWLRLLFRLGVDHRTLRDRYYGRG